MVTNPIDDQNSYATHKKRSFIKIGRDSRPETKHVPTIFHSRGGQSADLIPVHFTLAILRDESAQRRWSPARHLLLFGPIIRCRATDRKELVFAFEHFLYLSLITHNPIASQLFGIMQESDSRYRIPRKIETRRAPDHSVSVIYLIPCAV